ncbi:Lcl domain-containing protein [Muribaculum intestinale]|uniref:Lcl domain-containing protein n=1 Tax=Muribaculum intestinale TaxID=1796646 RepID=UPI0026F3EA52|nr:DUF1566 domain-containing protein [Muribaculum intestinale]
MSNNIEEAQLLKANREALVNSLHDLGFNGVTEETPLAEIAEHMKWAGGLRDLRLATINKSTGKYSDYTAEEWDMLSASAKASCVKLGVRIRAEGQDFIISKDDIYRSNGATTMPWAPNNSIDVKGLTNYGEGATGHLNDKDGKANTDLILAHGEANNIKFEAAEQARAYKASTIADGGYEDPTEWSLPAIGQLWLLYKYKKQINEALTVFFGTSQLLTKEWYWSSTEYNSAYAWHVFMNYGNVNNNNKGNATRVRAVAPVPESSAI